MLVNVDCIAVDKKMRASDWLAVGSEKLIVRVRPNIRSPQVQHSVTAFDLRWFNFEPGLKIIQDSAISIYMYNLGLNKAYIMRKVPFASKILRKSSWKLLSQKLANYKMYTTRSVTTARTLPAPVGNSPQYGGRWSTWPAWLHSYDVVSQNIGPMTW